MTRPHHGARWWKFDFHTHTPFSQDWRGSAISPRDWLLMFMRAKIDCVAVTDHNGGGWIDLLKREYEVLKAATNEADFRELVLFPGVEISVQGGVHVLAILDPSRTQSDIDTLLGAVDYRGTKGASDGVTSKSISDVASIVSRHGGVAIPAHVDQPKGLLEMVPSGEGGAKRPAVESLTMDDALKSNDILAVELVDAGATLPPVYLASARKWPRVLGSDCHTGSIGGSHAPSRRFTWIKMGQPSVEGLRLALLDGSPLSILCGDNSAADPNQHASLVIERVEIVNAYLAGRGQPLKVEFSPWLNAVIGGRGSGKSTILELLRAALARHEELPGSLRVSHTDFVRIRNGRDGNGALTHNTEVRVYFRKNGSLSRVIWTAGDRSTRVEDADEHGTWLETPSDTRERFPLRILSQKQVFALAEDRNSLLRIIDDSPEFTKRQWRVRALEIEADYLKVRAEQRAIRAGLGEKARLIGEIADLKKQASAIEKANDQGLLLEYGRIQREVRELQAAQERLTADIEAVRGLAADIERSLNVAGPDSGPHVEAAQVADAPTPGATAPSPFQQLIATGRDARLLLARSLRSAETDAKALQQRWTDDTVLSSWTTTRQSVQTRFEQLKTDLQASGVASVDEYGNVLTRRRVAEAELAKIEAAELRVQELERTASDLLEQHQAHRIKLTLDRIELLARILHDNSSVKINVLAFGNDPSAVESEFRKLISKEDAKLADDILSDRNAGVLPDLYRELPDDLPSRSTEFAARMTALKSGIRNAAAGAVMPNRSKWLSNHLTTLKPEQLDRLDLWWPEDALAPEYMRDGSWEPLSNASAGQKSAAILALVLAHGEQPIVIDQPEDDLDSRLIFELLVSAVRDAKPRRQVIVATHNANVVVNGDAEKVITMNFAAGQCRVQEDESGCLQEERVRDAVCRVLEGGERAFRQRYRRIMEGRRA